MAVDNRSENFTARQGPKAVCFGNPRVPTGWTFAALDSRPHDRNALGRSHQSHGFSTAPTAADVWQGGLPQRAGSPSEDQDFADSAHRRGVGPSTHGRGGHEGGRAEAEQGHYDCGINPAGLDRRSNFPEADGSFDYGCDDNSSHCTTYRWQQCG